MCERAAAALLPAYEQIADIVRQQPVQHADETGWRNRGKRTWLWVAHTLAATLFRIQPQRSNAACDALIDPHYTGVVVSDRYKPYERFKRRQLCHAHLLRNWTAISERSHADAQRLGQALATETARLLKRHRRFAEGKIPEDSHRIHMLYHKAHYAQWLLQAHDCADAKTQSLARELVRQWDALWTFIQTPGVEPTNNAAERALRPAVLWRKGSFGTQSDKGQRFVERMLSVAATARQQGIQLLDFLYSACLAQQQQKPLPVLFVKSVGVA